MAQNKGLTKKHSPLQKAHYQAYRLVNKRLANKIKKLRRRIRLNAAEITRKAGRKPPREVKLDVGAIDRLKSITDNYRRTT